MSEAVHNADQEYWRPPMQGYQELNVPVRAQTEACQRCSTEFAVGARFCHVCGAERHPEEGAPDSKLTRMLDFRLLAVALGLSIASLLAFIVGVACVIGALATGLVFSATTVLDWQAVQIWRIQWLLGAAAAFLAGILLKRS